MSKAEDEPHYMAARIRERVAERAHELGIQVDVRGEVIYLRGDVASEQRRRDVEEAARAAAPDRTVRNELSVVSSGAPEGEERLS
ncbi:MULTISPECIES: BON domain-containing protein [Thermomonospora]|uniref:Transport-associated n=1 Tax=Thermomonospora curvata (strain ATCC 19995 / DSM 43183 / JCM 3096 / KCTC 9072 / NBRC 15933 / NCIMB 10081 / Henssen B9) TaxID=471852 RepID=D1A3P2_THECD|nr:MULTISPECIES: BON domain-containing protein [Thermomonospora]ACY96167.1 transport-associated [Thermomonospora curvata DSM 43183]PKK15600.1 MAG: BON domain-containing protein [Thermomonospora sp. CIF 1]